MKKTITLEIEVNGKNMDADAQQAVMDSVLKALESTMFLASVKVQAPAPAPAPAPVPLKV